MFVLPHSLLLLGVLRDGRPAPVNLFSTVPLNAFGMYQVAFEMYPPETRAQLKFLVGGVTPPTNTRLQCTSVF